MSSPGQPGPEQPGTEQPQPEQPHPRRRAVIVGIIALAVAVVVAVAVTITVVQPGSSPTAGSATPGASASQTPRPTPSRTPTPAPTAPPSPAQTSTAPSPADPAAPQVPAGPAMDPSDPSTWIIRFDGVGPVSLGVPMNDQRQVLPDFTDITDPSCTEYYLDLEAPSGFSVLMLGGAQQPKTTVGVTFGNGGGTGPETQETTPRTAEGIGIDSTLDDLLATYPGIEKTGMYQFEEYPYYGLTDGQGAWIVFGIIQGKVANIQIATEAELPPENVSVKTIPSERCPA